MHNPSLSLIHPGRVAHLAKLVEDAKKRKGGPDTYPIPWRGKREFLPIVQVETKWLLLNLDNGRTRAEQEVKSLQLGNPDLFSDPTDPQAQEAQAEILRELDERAFATLREDLQLRGQREPAIVTAAGVLVNGNRRCVALRDLGVEYMSVVVLESSASPREIRTLEFELQIARDFREEYGDVNRLLLIERLMQEDEYDPEFIASRLGMTKAEVLAEKGILELMREYIDSVNGAERLGNIKGKYQAFKEAYAVIMEARKMGQHERAERLKSARFLGIMAGAGYRELRAVDEDFVDEYLVSSFEKEPDLKGLVGSWAPKENKQTEDLGPLGAFVDGAGSHTDKGKALLEGLVSHAQPSVSGGDGKSGNIPSPVVERARLMIQKAAKDAEQDAKDERSGSRPLDLLGEATGKLRRINLRTAVATGTFDMAEFIKALDEHRTALNALAAECQKLGEPL